MVIPATRRVTSPGSRAYRSLPSAANASQVRYCSPAGHAAASLTMIVFSPGSWVSTGCQRASSPAPSRTAIRASQSPATKAICSGAQVAGVHRPQVGEDVLGPVGQHEGDPLTGGEAERGEARRKLHHLLAGLRPGEGLPAIAGLVGERRVSPGVPGRPGEQVADGRITHRPLDLGPPLEYLSR